MAHMAQQEGEDVARRAFKLKAFVEHLQECVSSIERCSKPVIAAVRGGCVGAGVDLICACDIRLCTHDAWFTVKEIDLGLAADLGTLQRLPRVCGNESWVRELAYTARRFDAREAYERGLVSAIEPTAEAMRDGALKLASVIASKSPVAVCGTKAALNYSRDHSVEDGLVMQRIWNMAALQSEDVGIAAAAAAHMGGRGKTQPTAFSKL
ncbi:unnamed protein product [Vitrella brassicaformis CCMP3155]|uniref:Enoyl-CoA hydratase n=1 Tax=Vitrella brassicaformis (strain CCMP3155) TaxID=1169540 RepID=A0A0G4ESU3_VITBC|nr:unnamed protein product [Vitrella brassicaformis CCMP3155]|eukprot:CEM00955.1 unnamed protein product [Vitrella brassicaformis CCMP3155]